MLLGQDIGHQKPAKPAGWYRISPRGKSMGQLG